MAAGCAGGRGLRLDSASGGPGSAAVGLPQYPRFSAASLARSRPDPAGDPGRRRPNRREHHAHGGRAGYRADASRERGSRSGPTRRAARCTIGSPGWEARLFWRCSRGTPRGPCDRLPQPADGVTYAAKIDKAEALIDWTRDALEIERQVRAFNPWPIAETRLDGEQLQGVRGASQRRDSSRIPAGRSRHDRGRS